jgi:hypothetical protein
MSCLAPCPACNRHVSAHDAACPFCAAALPETFRCQPARVAPSGRLSRAAMIAAGAALMSASCSNAAPPVIVPLYGVAILPDAGADTSTSDGSQEAAAAQLEGAPPADDNRAPSPEPKKI